MKKTSGQSFTQTSGFHLFLQNFALFIIYFFTARIGLSLGAVSGFATLVWPPTGIALASILLFGIRLWPGIALGAFLVNYQAGGPIFAALGIGIGNTLEAIVAAYLLQKVMKFENTLSRYQDVLSLIFVASGLSTVISATIGVGSLYLFKSVLVEKLGITWRVWWIGDCLGDLVIAPLMLSWATQPSFKLLCREQVELIVLLFSTLFVSFVLFCGFLSSPHELLFPYALYPFIIWAAFRFRMREVVTVTALISILSIWGTSQGYGPFIQKELWESLLHLQVFIAVLAITGMSLSAVMEERKIIAQDLTHSKEQLMAIMGGVTEGVSLQDPEGRYLFVNEMAVQMTECSSAYELLGQTPAKHLMTFDLSDEEGRPLTKEELPTWLALKTKKPAELLVQAKSKKSGHQSWKMLKSIPLLDEHQQVKWTVGIWQDVTEFKEVIRSRDEFLSIASHELKTPLTSLSLQLQLLEKISKNAVSGLPQTHTTDLMAEMISKSQEQTNRISKLINELLDLTRIRLGKMELNRENFDFIALVQEVVNGFQLQASREGSKIRLHHEISSVGFWDRSRIEQVVSNLISNAIKYGNALPIDVEVKRLESQVLLTVTDRGIGVPADLKNKIFERFERGVPETKISGLGLGLYISRQIIEAHGGKIRVESKMGEGSKFIVELPIGQNQV